LDESEGWVEDHCPVKVNGERLGRDQVLIGKKAWADSVHGFNHRLTQRWLIAIQRPIQRFWMNQLWRAKTLPIS